jgi:hypothetical protein
MKTLVYVGGNLGDALSSIINDYDKVYVFELQ